MQLLVNLGTKGWDFTQELDEPSFRLVVVFARQHRCLLNGDIELVHGQRQKVGLKSSIGSLPDV